MEERAENGANEADERLHDPRLLGNLQEAEEESENSDQPQSNLGSCLREGERCGCDGRQLHEVDWLEAHGRTRRLEFGSNYVASCADRTLWGRGRKEVHESPLEFVLIRTRDRRDRP
jgi:hypothetical protein